MSPMQIFVKNLEGKSIVIEVDPKGSVLDLKKLIKERESIDPNDQRLIFGPKPLDDKLQLHEYDIRPNSTIHLVMRLPGGCG